MVSRFVHALISQKMGVSQPLPPHTYPVMCAPDPNHTKQSIPFSQFLRLRRLCSEDEDEDFQSKSLEMGEFFVQRGYPTSLLDTSFSKASQIPRSETLSNSVTNVTDHDRTPLVLTFHPFNFKVCDVIRKNFHILKNDSETSSIFSINPLVSFRHSKNIRETLVYSSLPQELSSPCGTFPCGVGQCKTCKFIDSFTTISAPKFFTTSITISRAPLPITSTVNHAVDVACFTLEKLEDV